MSGGSKVVDLRVSDVDFATPPAAAPVDEALEPLDLDQYGAPTSVWPRVFGAAAFLLASAWIGFIIWYAGPGLVADPKPLALMQFAAALAAPPAWIGVLWLIALRSSKAEALRFNATARSMRSEAAHLQTVVGAMANTIEATRLMLGDQITAMMAAASGMAEQITQAGKQAAGLDAAARTAEDKVNVLLATLPKAHAETEALGARIETIGLSASESAAALDAQLVALGERGREADVITSGAAERLAANIARMEATSETAGARLESVTATMSETVDGLLDRTAGAVDEARKGISAQGDAMTAMLAANQATLDRTATDSAAALGDRIAAIEAVVNHVAEVLGNGQAQIDAMARSIEDSNGAAQRFAGEAAPRLLESLMRIRGIVQAQCADGRDRRRVESHLGAAGRHERSGRLRAARVDADRIAQFGGDRPYRDLRQRRPRHFVGGVSQGRSGGIHAPRGQIARRRRPARHRAGVRE